MEEMGSCLPVGASAADSPLMAGMQGAASLELLGCRSRSQAPDPGIEGSTKTTMVCWMQGELCSVHAGNALHTACQTWADGRILKPQPHANAGEFYLISDLWKAKQGLQPSPSISSTLTLPGRVPPASSSPSVTGRTL